MSAAEDIAEQGPSMSLLDPVSGVRTELRLDDSEAVMEVVQGTRVTVKTLRNIFVALGINNVEAAEKLTAGQLAVAISTSFYDRKLVAMTQKLEEVTRTTADSTPLSLESPPGLEGEPVLTSFQKLQAQNVPKKPDKIRAATTHNQKFPDVDVSTGFDPLGENADVFNGAR